MRSTFAVPWRSPVGYLTAMIESLLPVCTSALVYATIRVSSEGMEKRGTGKERRYWGSAIRRPSHCSEAEHNYPDA
jgi:hypothetical protein